MLGADEIIADGNLIWPVKMPKTAAKTIPIKIAPGIPIIIKMIVTNNPKMAIPNSRILKTADCYKSRFTCFN